MPRSTQILVSILPYVLTVAILILVVQPKLTDASQVGEQLSSRQQQLKVLEARLKQREKLLSTKKQLNDEIKELRASLPKAPDIDLLLLDMEKMSDSSGTDLISIEPPGSTGPKKEQPLMDSLIAEVEGKLPLNPLQKKQKEAVKTFVKKKEEQPEKSQFGLKRLVRRVFVSGTYGGLNRFLKRLEAYRRVVGVRDLIIARPEDEEKESLRTLASDKGKKLNLDKPIMTFLMNIYYLP